jgi:hypothetical protein
MRKTNKYIYLSILMLIIFCYNCKKIEKSKTEFVIADKSFISSDSINDNSGFLVGIKNKIDFGNVKKGDTIKQNFILVNKGMKSVKIIGYTKSCDCTGIYANKDLIKSGDSITFNMHVSTNDRRLGKGDVTATIQTNGKKPFHLLRTRFEIIE